MSEDKLLSADDLLQLRRIYGARSGDVSSLLDHIEALEKERDDAIGYLTRNVIEASGATALPSLLGICTQADHICATLPLSTRLRREVLDAIGPFIRVHSAGFDESKYEDTDAIYGRIFTVEPEKNCSLTAGDLRRAIALAHGLSRATLEED